jgi:hypothetical protein
MSTAGLEGETGLNICSLTEVVALQALILASAEWMAMREIEGKASRSYDMPIGKDFSKQLT